MVNLFYDCYTILNKVYSDGAFIKQAINGTVIEEKNRALTVKICYGVLDKEIELSYYLNYLADKNPKLAIRTVIKICMYAIKFLNKKPYAVINSGVELVKKLGKGGASGFVNAILRKFLTAEIPLPENTEDYLSVKYSYPLFAVKSLIKFYGEKRTESIISCTNSNNTLVFYDVDGEKYLKDLNANYSLTPFVNVFTVKNFNRNQDYDKGIYTFQALGSVAICDVVSPCDNLLDCCAAPGGKSVRLSFKCLKVSSWDIHPHRVSLITDYKTRMKRDNIFESEKNSAVFDEQFDSRFDAVLCDCVCTGLGVINDNPDIRLNRSEENLKEILTEQKNILDNVCKYVKVGGYLYYSTCSVLPEENIYQVRAFLQRNKNFTAQEIDSKLPHEKQELALSFIPDVSGGLGFFVAKLKRNF